MGITVPVARMLAFDENLLAADYDYIQIVYGAACITRLQRIAIYAQIVSEPCESSNTHEVRSDITRRGVQNRKFCPKPPWVRRMRRTGAQGRTPWACAEQDCEAQWRHGGAFPDTSVRQVWHFQHSSKLPGFSS